MGSGASATEKALADASIDEILASLDQLRPATLDKLRNAVEQESGANMQNMGQFEDQEPNANLPDVKGTAVDHGPNAAIPDYEELNCLDIMEMSTLEKWAVWAEQGLVKKAEDTLAMKNAAEEGTVDMMELAVQESALNDTLSFVQQYLDADESTSPHPCKTKDDREKLHKLMERMQRSAEKFMDILRQIAPEDQGEGSDEGEDY